MIRTIDEGTRKARKAHWCFNCGTKIRKGEVHAFEDNVYDGNVGNLKMHLDCYDFLQKNFTHKWVQLYEIDYGCWAGLVDEYEQQDLDVLRGRYPHMVARMEYREQIQAIENEERWAKARLKTHPV